jgi:hypothetical protein
VVIYCALYHRRYLWLDPDNTVSSPPRICEGATCCAMGREGRSSRNQLGLKIPNPDVNSTDGDKQYFIEFKKYCGKYGSKMLIIIDNIMDPLDLYDDEILFPGDPTAKFTVLTLGCNLLFTTRRDFRNKLPNTIQHELKMLLYHKYGYSKCCCTVSISNGMLKY